MRAYVLNELRQPGGIEEIPLPECGPGEIRVRIARAGVNPIDWKIRSGQAGDRPTPRVAGQDVAGIVDALGAGVERFAIGDRVLAIARTHGGYAEATLVGDDAHGEPIAKIPSGVSDDVAAALPTPGITALGSLDALGVENGYVLLVTGAAGAVGAIAVQLAAKRGATVLATVRGTKPSAIRELGAEMVVDSADAAEVVSQVTDAYPDGIDGVMDLVSDGETLKTLGDVLRPGGKMLTANHVADEGWFAAHGFTAINFSSGESPLCTHFGLDTLTEAVVDGSLRVDVAGRYPFDEARKVLDEGAEHKLHGKYVLTLT